MSPMQPLLIENVQILELFDTQKPCAPRDILIENGLISAVGVGIAASDVRRIDGRNRLVMPGLINAHFHSSVNHMKGRLDGMPLEIFMLYESPALDELAPSPREAYLRTMLGAIEMLESGVTAVQDDVFFVPYPSPEIIDAVGQAYADVGIRATIALDQPELSEVEKLPFLDELASDDLAAELRLRPIFDAPKLLEQYDHLISRWHRAANGRVRAAVSCSAPQRVSPEYFRALDRLSRKHDLPFYAHMLETKLQRVFGAERLGGRSLVRYTHDLGLLSERMNVIHAIWVDDSDLDLLAKSGATIAHNPVSNLRLGSGIMPFRRMRDRGIPICLGVDEAIAGDAIDMWDVMKTTGLIHNITDPNFDNWPKAREILECATAGGARAMGLGSAGGEIAQGELADLILLDLDVMAFTPLNDLQRQLVYCETGSSVDTVIVGGDIVVDAGNTTRVDRSAILAEARALFAAKAPALAKAAAAMERYRPAYRAMYDKAASQDVGMNRWVEQST